MIYAGISHCSTSTIDWRTIGKTAHFQVPVIQRVRVGEKRLDSFHPLIPAVTFKQLRESQCLITSIINSNLTITQTSYYTVLALQVYIRYWPTSELIRDWATTGAEQQLLHLRCYVRKHQSSLTTGWFILWGPLLSQALLLKAVDPWKVQQKQKNQKNPPKTIHKEQVQENEHSEVNCSVETEPSEFHFLITY